MGATPSGENWLPIEGAGLPLTGATQESDALLLDLRSPAAFASGFIPGSFHLPDPDCVELLRANGLVKGKQIFVITETDEQMAQYGKAVASGLDLEFGGAWGPAGIEEWRKRYGDLGSLEVVAADTLAVRVSAWKTVVIDTRARAAFERARIREALHIPADTLTGSLTGLPAQTALCVVCEMGKRASFAASVMWNLGYRNVSILRGGFAAYLDSHLPLARS
ncbi:MAG TPA: rhodanese-like domain-containing protein [Bryobacteraceae bacterium]